jgi:hypothetical protein
MIEYIFKALRQRCKHEREYLLRPHERWFYTFKAIVCLILNRELPFRGYIDPPIHVAIVGSWQGYNWEFGVPSYAYEALATAHGAFKDWGYCIYGDGTP